MERKADESLPLVADEQGNKYFDNRITVEIKRADGSLFFKRTFVKTDFAKCLSNSYGRNGALLGVVFNEVKDNNLYFAASVGSPDIMSDSFVPIVVKLSRTVPFVAVVFVIVAVIAVKRAASIISMTCDVSYTFNIDCWCLACW